MLFDTQLNTHFKKGKNDILKHYFKRIYMKYKFLNNSIY